MNVTERKSKTVKFASPSELAKNGSAPWRTDRQSTYQDLILKPEYRARRYKFPTGTTWFRIVPALSGSRGWMLGLHSLNYKGGRHAHPKSLTPGTRSVYDEAYEWLKVNKGDTLYSKANREGVRLLTDPLCLFWMLAEEESKVVARLVLASGYDGSRGGTPGLGHMIWKLAEERDEDGNLVANPVDAEAGLQIGIERTQLAGSRYPSYTIRKGRIPVPVSKYLDRMEPAEIDTLAPLEDIVHKVSESEEWQLLENVLDSETVSKIREAQSSGTRGF